MSWADSDLGKVLGVARFDDRDGAGRPAVERGVDHHEDVAVAEVREQVEAAGPAVEQR